MTSAPPPIRPAATILLVRDTSTGIEVFMEQRHVQSGFVGGAYVFPGGRVDPDDEFDPSRCVGLDVATADRRLGMQAGGLAHHVAALRECFEEAGVLLAYDRTGRMVEFSDPAVERHYQDARNRLNAGSVTWLGLLEENDLTLATDRIGYWSHWITPLGEPRRYDTRFFVTVAPEGQAGSHDDWELTNSAWVAPAEAIDRAKRGEWMIIFPTLMNLKTLAEHRSAGEAVAWAARQPLPLPANLPKVYQGKVLLPGDEHYELGEPDISKLDREERDRAFLP